MQAGGQRFDPANLHHKDRFEYSMRIEYSNLSLKEDRKTCTLKTEQDEIRFDCIRASNREVKNFNCGTSNSRRVTITTVETAKEACIILTFLLRTKGDQNEK